MSDSDQYVLCWNIYNKNMTSGFHSLYLQDKLTDVTITAEGQTLHAHRMVLSVCSPYFQTMFASAPAQQHPILFLKDIKYKNLQDLLTFMYCGEVHVKQDELAGLISTAEALKVKGLTDSSNDSINPVKTKVAMQGKRAAKRPRKRLDPDKLATELDIGANETKHKRKFRILPKKDSTVTKSDHLQKEINPIASTSTTEYMDLDHTEHTMMESECEKHEVVIPAGILDKDEYDEEYVDEDYGEEKIDDPNDKGEPEHEFRKTGLLQFVLSNQGFPQLCHGGHVFMRYKTRNNRHYWKCTESRLLKCQAKIVTVKKNGATELCVTHKEHNHDVVPEKYRYMRRKRQVKSKQESDESQINQTSGQDLNESSVEDLNELSLDNRTKIDTDLTEELTIL